MDAEWRVILKSPNRETAFIELMSELGPVFGVEILPTTSALILEILQEARDKDAQEGVLPARAGWRDRAKIDEAIASSRGYGLHEQSISRYMTQLTNALKQEARKNNVEMPPLLERRKRHGMRLADGVRLHFQYQTEAMDTHGRRKTNPLFDQ